MRNKFVHLILTTICSTFASASFAQPEVKVDTYCGSVTVDGVAGQIWRMTENGKVNWVILDKDRQYLADAPERCIEVLSRILERQDSGEPPSINPIPSAGNPAARPLTLPDAGVSARNEVVSAHNQVRRAVGIREDMEWSAELAAYAQEWANVLKNERDCRIEHRPSAGRFAQRYGENLSWVKGQTQSGAQAVMAWASEKSDYDYVTGTCKGICGHYTQIVWRKSRYVGCATATCPGRTDSQLWVCNYAPPGNVVGEKPY